VFAVHDGVFEIDECARQLFAQLLRERFALARFPLLM
jgi:hypothetical protein